MNKAASTVAQAFANAAQAHGQRPFVCVLAETAAIYGVPAGETTYAAAQTQIERLRAAYAAAGYGHGHRVGLQLENRPAFFLHWFALNGLGVSVVPINPDLRSAELEYLVGHSEIGLAIAPAARHAMLRAAASAAGRALQVMGADDAPPSAPSTAPLAERDVDVNTECALLYTSGTTGRPKGCILPNRYFLHAGAWYAGIGGLAQLQVGGERMLTPLPLVHMNAMAYSTMAMVLTGGCLIVLDRFHPATWWASVRESQATVVHYLGVMPAMLMKAAAQPQDREHTVRFGFGAGVDRSLHAPFEQRFGFPLLEAWAMTETGAGAVVIANLEPRLIGTSCFGREGADMALRIVADSGQEAAVDEPGELLVRHAGDAPRDGFFAGYLKDEAATAEAWEDGWFHTGDIVRRGPDGQLHFIDRRKNVIRRSGENISAVEVESVLLQHPRVKAAAVAAVPDALRGDEVLACVVADNVSDDAAARQALAAELVAWCLQRLAYYKAPGYVGFVAALPLTASQKVQRGELKALAASLVGQPVCVDTQAMKRRQE
jgi:acyl-CoA synthetase (AMP-forming)/AMP-acid ligase II